MKLVTANIKSNPLMRQSYVNSDLLKVRLLGDVIFFQEIAPQRYKDALHDLMPHRAHVALGTECPITYKPWRQHSAGAAELPNMHDAPRDVFPDGVKMTGAVKMHGGRSHVTPSRYVVYAILKSDGGAPPIVWMNSHMLSSAWSNRHPLTKKWRRAQWWIHFNKQKRMVLYFYSKGLTVVGGADTNRVDMPKFHASQRWLAHGGIDHLYCVQAPGGARVAVRESHAVHGLHTDHAPRVADLIVTKPGG